MYGHLRVVFLSQNSDYLLCKPLRIYSTMYPVRGTTGRPLAVEFIHVTAFSFPSEYNKPFSSRRRLGCFPAIINSSISWMNLPYRARHFSVPISLEYCCNDHIHQRGTSGCSIS